MYELENHQKNDKWNLYTRGCSLYFDMKYTEALSCFNQYFAEQKQKDKPCELMIQKCEKVLIDNSIQ